MLDEEQEDAAVKALEEQKTQAIKAKVKHMKALRLHYPEPKKLAEHLAKVLELEQNFFKSDDWEKETCETVLEYLLGGGEEAYGEKVDEEEKRVRKALLAANHESSLAELAEHALSKDYQSRNQDKNVASFFHFLNYMGHPTFAESGKHNEMYKWFKELRDGSRTHFQEMMTS